MTTSQRKTTRGDPDPGHGGAESPGSHYVLLALGDAEGQYASYPFPDGDSVTIGRSHKCTLRIGDPSFSRRHAILHVGLTITIEDLDSANGLRVRDASLLSASAADSVETVEFFDRGLSRSCAYTRGEPSNGPAAQEPLL